MEGFTKRELVRSVHDIDAELERITPAIENARSHGHWDAAASDGRTTLQLRNHVEHLQMLRAHQQALIDDTTSACTDEVMDGLRARIVKALVSVPYEVDSVVHVQGLEPLAIRVRFDADRQHVTLLPDPTGWLTPHPFVLDLDDDPEVWRRTLRLFCIDEAHVYDQIGC